jgi:hypothetical protein
MGTYYKYQERDPSSEINWAEVGANFSGMLQEESRVRTEKKQAIDDATREQQLILDNAVQGDNANMNQWTLDYAANATEQMMMTNRLLKSGDLNMKEYTMMRQNLSDGTDQAFTLSQEYQSEYADKMARSDCKDPSGVGCSQQLEVDMMAGVEGFGNFTKSQLVIDPQTGKVMVGFYKDNGKGVMELDSNPNNLVGINNLRNRIKDKIDLYDMEGAVEKAVKSFGKFETIIKKVGSLNAKGVLLNVSDPTLRDKEIKNAVSNGLLSQADADLMVAWEDIFDAKLEGELSDPYNVSSLLTNNLGQINGKEYTFEWDPKVAAADKTGTVILLKMENGRGVPDWSTPNGKKQRAEAKEGLRTVMLGAIDHTVKAFSISDSAGRVKNTTPNKPTRGDEIRSNAVGLWNSIYGATIEDMNSRLNALLVSPQGQAGNFKTAKFVKQPNGDTRLEYTKYASTKGGVEENKTGDNGILIPANATQEQWSEAGIVFTGEVNKEKRNIGFSGSEYTDPTGTEASLDTPIKNIDKATDYIEQTLVGTFGLNQKERDFVTDFQLKFKDLGFTIEPEGFGTFSQKVIITAPNKEKMDFYTNNSSKEKGDEGDKKRDVLINWLKSHTREYEATKWVGSGGKVDTAKTGGSSKYDKKNKKIKE